VVKAWAERHMADVGAARADYDAAQAGAGRSAGERAGRLARVG
jgi:hypothetical protein